MPMKSEGFMKSISQELPNEPPLDKHVWLPQNPYLPYDRVFICALFREVHWSNSSGFLSRTIVVHELDKNLTELDKNLTELDKIWLSYVNIFAKKP